MAENQDSSPRNGPAIYSYALFILRVRWRRLTVSSYVLKFIWNKEMPPWDLTIMFCTIPCGMLMNTKHPLKSGGSYIWFNGCKSHTGLIHGFPLCHVCTLQYPRKLVCAIPALATRSPIGVSCGSKWLTRYLKISRHFRLHILVKKYSIKICTGGKQIIENTKTMFVFFTHIEAWRRVGVVKFDYYHS